MEERNDEWFSDSEYAELTIEAAVRANDEHFDLELYVSDAANNPPRDVVQNVKETVVISETLLLRLKKLDLMQSVDEYESFKKQLAGMSPARKSCLRHKIIGGNAQAAIHLSPEQYAFSIPVRAQLVAILA